MFWWRRRIGSLKAAAPSVSFNELKKRVKTVVIDDHQDSFPTEALKRDGYTVDWWPKLDAHLLHRLEAGDYDIIILDIVGITDGDLSDTGDGRGVLRRIKQVNPNQIVVAFSGQSYDFSSQPFWKSADDTLRKPVSLITCKELLDRLMKLNLGIAHYWATVETLLARSDVSAAVTRRLERKVVKAANRRRSLSLEDVKQVVGAIDTIGTVAAFVAKIAGLWMS